MTPDDFRQCESCPLEAIAKERFCKHCRKALLKQMAEDGYLTRPPLWYPSQRRRPEQQEVVRETKFGLDR